MSTSETLRVGDLVIMQHPTYFEELEHAVGTIVGALRPRISTDLRTMGNVEIEAYGVQVSETFVVNAQPYQVRLLREPDADDDTGESRGLLQEVEA